MQRITITAALLAASVTRRSSSPTPPRIRARWRATRGRILARSMSPLSACRTCWWCWSRRYQRARAIPLARSGLRARLKSRREHRAVLAPPARALLKHLYREDGNPHLFVGARNEALGDAAMSATLRRRNAAAHCMRSAFSTWAHEQTAHSNHVIEICLAHAVGSDVEKIYRRTDLFNNRRKLMEQWAAYCCSPPAMAGKTVVPWRLDDFRGIAVTGNAWLPSNPLKSTNCAGVTAQRQE